MSERGGEVWAFLAGAFIGGVAALLFAPAKGSETRAKIRQAAEDAYSKGEQLVETGRVEADKLISKGREKLESFAQKCEEKAVQ
ncbi:MAG TPA: YtxH domain-containing protein [Candidatus Fermentibacter sp.]|nr:YtxH domain-containing protein [Candidatus Fermentibacter sp.]HRY61651.1 YtxH domain-containing protein [Candidatus Fermentibacter sp.]